MTAPALAPGLQRRRVLFGLLDADSWSWASIKATFWFVLIILLLGYIPDRAYYFMVLSTIDVGILAISPINICPPENDGLPCPVPAGAALPWEPAPQELGLPAGRIDGGLVQSGTRFLYVGGTDGTTASATVHTAEAFTLGTFGPWTEAPALPAARSKAAVIFSGGSVYVFGGLDAAGQPTTTAYVLTPDAATGAVTAWQTAEAADLPIDLPEARSGASIVALADGLLLLGGADATNAPTTSVWKATLGEGGSFGAWEPLGALPEARADAEAGIVGTHVFVYGGRGTSGPTATVLRGEIAEVATDDHGVAVTPAPGAEAAPTSISWAVGTGSTNLPAPRTDAVGFTTNGGLYLVGGSDGTALHNDLYWTIPSATGDIGEWKHLTQSDLPEPGLSGATAVVSGPNAFIVGGRGQDGVTGGAARANLSPQPPFFQLGLFGATIPAFKLEGEVGQQLGFMAAAGIATGNFILLILIGWGYAHPQRARELLHKVRRRGRSG